MTKGKHKTEKAAEKSVPEDVKVDAGDTQSVEKNENDPDDVESTEVPVEGNSDTISDETKHLNEEIAAWKDKYIRLTAEYDNYRKRTQRERDELLKTASEGTIKDILGVVDDFERALKALKDMEDAGGYEGVKLIYDKFCNFLKSKGVEVVNRVGEPFDTDYEEAVTKFPAPDPEMKGKVIDVIQKGYLLNGKVIRYAKVVVGE